MEDLMKLLTIPIVAVMLALLPAYTHALASKHHKERGAGRSAGHRVGPDVSPAAPVSVPEPGSILLLATGLTTVGGFAVRKWYVTKKREKRLARHEP
jgi:PEP-CTERM motif